MNSIRWVFSQVFLILVQTYINLGTEQITFSHTYGVVQLTSRNFEREIYQNKHVSFVYYRSGSISGVSKDCQLYDQIWKGIVEYFAYSRNIIGLYTVDCTVSEKLCKAAYVKSDGSPAVRFYSGKPDSMVAVFTEPHRVLVKLDIPSNIMYYVQTLRSYTLDLTNGIIPNLDAYEGENLKELRNLHKTVLLIMTANSSMDSSAVRAILSLHRMPDLVVRYAGPKNERLLDNLGLREKIPCVVVINERGFVQELEIKKTFLDTLFNYLVRHSKTPVVIQENREDTKAAALANILEQFTNGNV